MTEDTHNTDMSEAEMRAFFERLVSKVVGLSAQAAELVQLRQDVENIRRDLATVQSENQWLRSQLNDVTAHRDQLRLATEGFENKLRQTESDLIAANTLLQESDNKSQRQADYISRLEADLSAARNTAQDQAHKAEGFEYDNADLKQKLEKAHVTIDGMKFGSENDGHTIREQYQDIERLTKELAASNEALTRVRNAVNSLPSF